MSESFSSFLDNVSNERAKILSSFTIGELDNPITKETITKKLELLDEINQKWFSFFLKTQMPA